MYKLPSLIAYLDGRLGPHSGRGPEFQWNCPACIDRTGDESAKRKLGINLNKGMGGCFRCGWGFRDLRGLFRYINGGSVRVEEESLLRREAKLPKSDVRSAVTDLLRTRRTLQRLKRHLLPREYVPLGELSLQNRKKAQYRLPFAYLERRGVFEVERRLRLFQIGYCATGDYAQRLIFPVVQHEEVVYFTSRYCGDHAMKSRNPPNVDGFHQRGTCLLNYDNCVGMPMVGIVEGPFSCMAFQGIHAAGSLALMGKYITEEQVRLIAELVPYGLVEIVVVLDPGAGGPVDRVYEALLGRVPEVSVLALQGGDPHDLRASLPELMDTRGVPSISSRALQRLNG